MRSPSEAEWKQQVLAQAEANKAYFENEKQLERARKDLLNNEYKNQQQEREMKLRQRAIERAGESEQMQSQIERYRGDQTQSLVEQRSKQINLAQSYADQITQTKLSNIQNKRKQLDEEQNRIEASLRLLEEEKQQVNRRKEQARQEMIKFYNAKTEGKHLESIDLPSNSSHQRSLQSSSDDLSISQIGNNQKFQQYMKQFNEKQAFSAKNFVPFDDKKGSKIDELVQRGVQQDHQRWLEEEQLKRNNLQSRRLDLKNGLQMQLAMKEKNSQVKKQEFIDNQSQIVQRSNDYLNDQTTLRQKRLSQKQVYRDILDTQLAEKEQSKLNSGQLSPQKRSSSDLSPEQLAGPPTQLRTPTTQSLQSSSSAAHFGHNPLTNPIPSNMQNPYLLRQLISSQMTSQGSQNRLNYANIAQSNIVGANYKKTQIY